MNFVARRNTKNLFAILALFLTMDVGLLLSVETASAEKRTAKYRGWDYLVSKLREEDVAEEDLNAIYGSKRINRFDKVYFNVPPRESRRIYKGFAVPAKIQAAKHYLDTYKKTFIAAEKKYNVSPYPIAAIMLVETYLGKNTGNHAIIYRLSRLANIADPINIKENYKRLKKRKPQITLEEVTARAEKLHSIFFPEIVATIDLAKTNGFDVFKIKGSSAGAFGIPQFLPTSYIKYGVDGNGDGKVSLFNIHDAIHSVGNYLASFGWKEDASEEEKKKAIWHYNHSDPYVDTVYEISKKLAAAK